MIVADTMDLWINIQRDELGELLTKIDGLVLNDAEAKLLAEDENLVRAGHAIRAMGPKFVVIKKGERLLENVELDCRRCISKKKKSAVLMRCS